VGAPSTDQERRRTERWFLRRGLPHLIEGYSASRDVLTRAVPLLTVVFLFEVLNAPKRSFPVWLDAVAVAGGLAILLGGWALANHARGRPALARPDDVGWPEIAVFVAVPPILPLVFGVQVRSAVLTLVGNGVLLGVVYLGASYAVVPMTRWAGERLVAQATGLLRLLIRVLPLLALFVTFLFLTAEVWQSAGTVHGIAYWILLGLFFVVGTAFVVVRIPRDVDELADFDSWDDVYRTAGAAPGVPAAILDRPTAGAGDPETDDGSAHLPDGESSDPAGEPHGSPPGGADIAVATTDVVDGRPGGAGGRSDLASLPPLSRRQWGNVGLVLLFSQGLQIATVSLLIGGFFVAIGVLTVSEETTRAWSGSAHVLASVGLDGRELVVTEELLRVAGFLMAFVGLNFTVYLITDTTYREEFRDEVVAEVRQALAVRALYLSAPGGPGPVPPRAKVDGAVRGP